MELLLNSIDGILLEICGYEDLVEDHQSSHQLAVSAAAYAWQSQSASRSSVH